MNKPINETRFYGGVMERVHKGCNGYRGSELVPECETTCSNLMRGLEELGVTIIDPPRRDYGGLRIIRRGVSFEDIMEEVECDKCERRKQYVYIK